MHHHGSGIDRDSNRERQSRKYVCFFQVSLIFEIRLIGAILNTDRCRRTQTVLQFRSFVLVHATLHKCSKTSKHAGKNIMSSIFNAGSESGHCVHMPQSP